MHLRVIKSFCKGNKTANEKMSVLYDKFSVIHKGKYPRKDFELGLLSAGAKVARLMGEKCLRYPHDQYEKFIREQEFVSPEFWAYVHSIGESHLVPVPSPIKKVNCPARAKETTTPFSDAFIKKEISQSPIKKEPPIKEASKSQTPPDPEEKCYEGLLPGDWPVMTLSQQIDFTKKVHHKGFQEFILSKNPQIKTYFSKVRGAPVRMPIYVTLFSFPSDNYTAEARGLLKTFVHILNDVGRARLQYLEYNEPPTVEIREIRN